MGLFWNDRPYDQDDDEAEYEFEFPTVPEEALYVGCAFPQCDECGYVNGFHTLECDRHEKHDLLLMDYGDTARGVVRFLADFSAWLNTSEGRHEVHYAEHTR